MITSELQDEIVSTLDALDGSPLDVVAAAIIFELCLVEEVVSILRADPSGVDGAVETRTSRWVTPTATTERPIR